MIGKNHWGVKERDHGCSWSCTTSSWCYGQHRASRAQGQARSGTWWSRNDAVNPILDDEGVYQGQDKSSVWIRRWYLILHLMVSNLCWMIWISLYYFCLGMRKPKFRLDELYTFPFSVWLVNRYFRWLLFLSLCVSLASSWIKIHLSGIDLFEHGGEGRHMWDITDDTYAIYQKVRFVQPARS